MVDCDGKIGNLSRRWMPVRLSVALTRGKESPTALRCKPTLRGVHNLEYFGNDEDDRCDREDPFFNDLQDHGVVCKIEFEGVVVSVVQRRHEHAILFLDRQILCFCAVRGWNAGSRTLNC